MQGPTNNISKLPQKTLSQIKSLYKDQKVQNLLIEQLQQIFTQSLSIVVIYQKVYIKIKHQFKHPTIQYEDHQNSLFMIKIGKYFPIDDGCFQPKIYDTRDLMYQVLGQAWSYELHRLKNIIQKLPQFQQKLLKRNQQYLALQKTGQFLLGDVFIYNQLQQHSSLELFVDRIKQNNNTVIGVSETHFLTFKKIHKKFKTKQQEQLDMKSKSLYGKKFLLARCCDLQCIESLNINSATKQISITILKYKSIKSFNQYQPLNRKFNFGQEQNCLHFIRCILKNITKYQPMKINFIPSLYEKDKIQSKEDSAIQKVLQLNDLQSRLEGQFDHDKREDLLSRLNKSYQKLIQFYSARANPYYLIYVNKLNYLYQRYFVKDSPQQAFKEGARQ